MNSLVAREAAKLERDKIMTHLQHASWVNKDNDELQARKDCLSYLRKLGKKLRPNLPNATANNAASNGVIAE